MVAILIQGKVHLVIITVTQECTGRLGMKIDSGTHRENVRMDVGMHGRSICEDEHRDAWKERL